ncbi:MAG TPA: DUF1559 domain-containing protein [Capsulimonadaceae bacterium]|jgi:prepilin-type N-terminal cleavage/methylation domain-containing protein/prepilin-type processing-associated H-X9-DG protein
MVSITRRQLRTAKSGFTLIELLVVIAIIAILAAILFPVFAKAREKARGTACTSNLKQISLAFAQYTQDYDELFPCGKYQAAGAGANGGQGWAGQIFPYLKAQAIFVCPSDPTPPVTNYSVMSYEYNQLLDSKYGNNPGTTSLSKLTAPANIVCLYEVQGAQIAWFQAAPTSDASSPAQIGYPGYYAGSSSIKYATGNMGSPFTSTNYYTATPVHTEGSNWLAADGHVKWLRGEKVSNGGAAANATDPANVNIGPMAAGTDNMSNGSGIKYTLTFSTM